MTPEQEEGSVLVVQNGDKTTNLLGDLGLEQCASLVANLSQWPTMVLQQTDFR